MIRMQITMPYALVIESRFGQSKSGNPYCVFRILDEVTLDVYDLMQFGEGAAVAAGISKGSRVSLDFNVAPARDGGVRLDIVGVEKID